MSAILLPAATWESLDRASRSFVWGTTVEKRKLHLLAWRKLCRSKTEGGLGFRPAREMNKALLAKVGWRLLSDKDSLWARVLRSKYKVGDVHDYSWMVPKGSWSSTWKSVGVGLREVVSRGLGWVLGDGKTIRFGRISGWEENRFRLRSLPNYYQVCLIRYLGRGRRLVGSRLVQRILYYAGKMRRDRA